MSDVKWIKIVTGLFDDDKILIIDTPENKKKDLQLILWVKLLCLAGKLNKDGKFILDGKPYTDEMLAATFKRPSKDVAEVLSLFVGYGMLDKADNVYSIKKWGKHQDFTKLNERNEKQKGYQQRYRERTKVSANVNTNDILTECKRGDSVSVFPSPSISISNSYSNKEDNKRELTTTNTLIKDCLDLYKKYAPTLYDKEEGLNLFNSFGKGVSAVVTAIEDNPPLTEKEYIALLERAEKSEYIQSMQRPSLEYLIKKRGEILNGERDKLFGKPKEEASGKPNRTFIPDHVKRKI